METASRVEARESVKEDRIELLEPRALVGMPPRSGGDTPADHLVVVVYEGGQVHVRGQPEDVFRFFQECAAAGFVVSLDYLSRCG